MSLIGTCATEPVMSASEGEASCRKDGAAALLSFSDLSIRLEQLRAAYADQRGYVYG